MKRTKLIWQIWHDWAGRGIPNEWRISPESIKRFMPDWEYHCFSEEEDNAFVQEFFPDFWPYYQKFPYHIQRCDAIRYMRLYIHGGIYLDFDYKLLKSLNSLLGMNDRENSLLGTTRRISPIMDDRRNSLLSDSNDFHLVPSGNIPTYVTNSFIHSKPGCDFWLKVIEEMKLPPPFWAIGKHFHVMTTTGPMMLSRVLHREGHKYKYGLLPKDQITPCSVCDINSNKRKRSEYIEQLSGSSWISWDSKLYIFFLCNWYTLLIILLILLIFFALWMISR